MKIVRPGAGGHPTELRTQTFTGTVWVDPLMSVPEGVTAVGVFFTPAARTFWHRHERGQLLRVLTGRGVVCARGGQPEVLGPGDLVWASPGEEHWHGGGPDTSMLHLAISLGVTTWLDEVSDDEYGRSGS